MVRSAITVVLAAILLTSVVAAAQERPDLSGTWQMDVARSDQEDLRINRWGPRRGGDRSTQPLVQARWDGRKLIMLKAPGEGSSALWILSLAEGGAELVIETISMRNLGESMFRASSIPNEYARLRFVFRKIA